MACENEFEENVESLRLLLSSNNVVSFKIHQITCMAGSSSGDNYMSVVKRVRISGHDSNQVSQNLSVIIKRQIPSLSRRQLFRCDEAFCNEINAYNHIVPLLEQYTTDPASASLFPKCYYAGQDDNGEIIVLEDLKPLGYIMQNRLSGMELTYCQQVMKQLAKLHAASIAAKQLNNETFHEKCQQIRDIVYCKEAEDLYKNMLETSIQESLFSLRESNVDGCLTEPIRLIEKLQTKLFNYIQECITNSKDSLSVMCHGDLWINNIMFVAPGSAGQTTSQQLTEAETSAIFANAAASTASSGTDFSSGSATSSDSDASSSSSTSMRDLSASSLAAVKFFDLQAMRYTSLVFDILHFIYTSTKRDLREAYTKTLLQTYSCALSSNLEEQFTHGGNGPDSAAAAHLAALRDTFSLDNIMEEYYRHILYGLAISMWILPAVTFDPNNIPNLDVISEMNHSAKEIKCTQKLTPEYHSRLKDLALEFHQNGYLNSYVLDLDLDLDGDGDGDVDVDLELV